MVQPLAILALKDTTFPILVRGRPTFASGAFTSEILLSEKTMSASACSQITILSEVVS